MWETSESDLQKARSQELAEWQDHPVTRLFLEWVKTQREELKELWADGNFTAAFDIEMMAKNASATGAASIYKKILTLEVDDLWRDDNE